MNGGPRSRIVRFAVKHRGARPSDIPIERPTKFELSVNLKAAKALGLTIPQSLRLRTDEVIQ